MFETYSIDQDLKEARGMAKALVPYVHQNQLYGNTGGGFFSRMPSMTIGGLLLRLRRLDVLRDQMTDKQEASLDKAQARKEEILGEWRMHCESKMRREANSRLDAMRTYFQECANNMTLCANQYYPETLRRTTVQELVIELEQMGIHDDELVSKMRTTDGQLRRYVQPSDFVWAQDIQVAYDRQVFWWLYNRPVAPDK